MQEPTPVVFGEVLFDCFEDGSRVLGGAPFNVAWHLQAFGCAPLLISSVGDDPMGRQIRDTMQHWGMTTVGLQKDSVHRTGEVRVSLTDGQPSFEILPDRAFDHISGDCLPPMQPSLIYHGSLGLRLPESMVALEQLKQKYAASIFMDVNLRPPWWDKEQLSSLLAHARWVKINDHELETLVADAGSLETKAGILLETYDLHWVIVTRGKQGAFLLDSDGNLSPISPGHITEVVDTVGAGDAFAAVCILGLLKDWPAGLMMERAQAFAGLLIAQRGATINDPDVYAKLLEDWRLAG